MANGALKGTHAECKAAKRDSREASIEDPKHGTVKGAVQDLKQDSKQDSIEGHKQDSRECPIEDPKQDSKTCTRCMQYLVLGHSKPCRYPYSLSLA